MLENAPHQDPQVNEESEHGDVDDGSSMATTLSLGDAWHPELRGSPSVEETEATEPITEPKAKKVDDHIEKARKELTIPVVWPNSFVCQFVNLIDT